MKDYLLALIAALILGLCIPQTAFSQIIVQGGGAQGMFGYRVLGVPFVGNETQGTFGPRTIGGSYISAAAPGVFGSRIITQSLLPPHVNFSSAVFVDSLGNVAYPAQFETGEVNSMFQYPAPVNFSPESTNSTLPAPTWLPETNAFESANLVEPGLGATPDVNPAAASNVALPRSRLNFASSVIAPRQSFVRSQELSERLTSIARTKDMLSGQGIDVYLSENIALIQGTVRTPGDRVLMANILSFEPSVWQIDNRLTVEGARKLSSK